MQNYQESFVCCVYNSHFLRYCIQNPADIDWDQYWNPRIYVDNTVDEPQQTVCHSVIYDVNVWEAYIVERHRLKGTFLENLELFHFPFDTQVTSTVIAAE